MHEVFFAHSYLDEARIGGVIKRLGRLSVGWCPTEPLSRSPDWWLLAASAIERSTLFVFVTSRHSLKSEPCRRELALAAKLARPIVQWSIEAVGPGDIPPEISGLPELMETRNVTADAHLVASSVEKMLQSHGRSS